MVYYDTDSHLQFTRERGDRLAAEMRRCRRLTPDEAGFFSRARLAPALAGQLERLRRRRDNYVPAHHA